MLSSSLGDLLATMETVRQIDGVQEYDSAIVEARQEQENRFLDQVLDLAGQDVVERQQRTPTKYSDGQLTFSFDNENYAKAIMDLAKANGVADGEIVPDRSNGMINLHIMPHVFASEQMEDVRHVISLGLDEDSYRDYVKMEKALKEANPNHDAQGLFMKDSAIKKASGKEGSRSFQFSAPKDNKDHKRNRPHAHVNPANNKRQTFNSPQFKYNNRQYRLRAKQACGRNARNYFRAKMGRAPLKSKDLYRRCRDGKIPTWAESVTDAYTATKEYLVGRLRQSKQGK